MPVAIINAFPAYAAVPRSALDMADTSSPTLGESSADGASIDAYSDETAPRFPTICATVVLPTRRGGGADDSWREILSAAFRCLTKSTRGIASAIVVPANYVFFFSKIRNKVFREFRVLPQLLEPILMLVSSLNVVDARSRMTFKLSLTSGSAI
jgi:hypothetical protein